MSGTYGGMQTIGTVLQDQTNNRQEKPTFTANITKVKGSHTYKAGGEVYTQGTLYSNLRRRHAYHRHRPDHATLHQHHQPQRLWYGTLATPVSCWGIILHQPNPPGGLSSGQGAIRVLSRRTPGKLPGN